MNSQPYAAAGSPPLEPHAGAAHRDTGALDLAFSKVFWRLMPAALILLSVPKLVKKAPLRQGH